MVEAVATRQCWLSGIGTLAQHLSTKAVVGQTLDKQVRTNGGSIYFMGATMANHDPMCTC